MTPFVERFWGIQLKDGSLLKVDEILRWKTKEDAEGTIDFRERFRPDDIGSIVATEWTTYIQIAENMEALDE